MSHRWCGQSEIINRSGGEWRIHNRKYWIATLNVRKGLIVVVNNGSTRDIISSEVYLFTAPFKTNINRIAMLCFKKKKRPFFKFFSLGFTTYFLVLPSQPPPWRKQCWLSPKDGNQGVNVLLYWNYRQFSGILCFNREELCQEGGEYEPCFFLSRQNIGNLKSIKLIRLSKKKKTVDYKIYGNLVRNRVQYIR